MRLKFASNVPDTCLERASIVPQTCVNRTSTVLQRRPKRAKKFLTSTGSSKLLQTCFELSANVSRRKRASDVTCFKYAVNVPQTSLKRGVCRTCVKRALYFSDANEDVRIVTSSLSGRRISGRFFLICEQFQATQTMTLLSTFSNRYAPSTLCEDFAKRSLRPFLLRVFSFKRDSERPRAARSPSNRVE